MSRADRPRWRVNALSFVGHAMAAEGAEVFYTPTEDGEGNTNGVGHNLSPLNDEAQAIVDAQSKDHPDKTKHAARRKAAAIAVTEKEIEVEQDKGDGVVKGAAKGDTRTEKAPKAPKPAKEPKPKADKPAKDAGAADEQSSDEGGEDPDDVG